MDDKDEFPIGGAIAIGLVGLIFLLSLLYFTGGLNRIVGREFSKFDEETRRQVQEESRAYQEGMAQNLDRLCLEWDRTGNAAIAQSIRHRTASYNGELPQHVQACVDLARNVK